MYYLILIMYYLILQLDEEDFIYQRTTSGKQFLFVCLKGGGLFEFTETPT